MLRNEDAESHTSYEAQDWGRITHGHEEGKTISRTGLVKAVLHGNYSFLLTNGAALACFDTQNRSPMFRFTPGLGQNGHTNVENVGVRVAIVDFNIQAVGDDEVVISVVTSDVECCNSKQHVIHFLNS